MSIKCDKWISHNANVNKMIFPFVNTKCSDGVLSYGLSSYGYDARVSDEFRVFSSEVDSDSIVDPKNFDPNVYVEVKGDYCIVPPNGFVLASTLEYFKIPRNVLVLCLGKSTYARCGLALNVTPLEPGWEGNVTLEFANTGPKPIKVYSNEGICQFLFFMSEDICENSYDELNGKYMNQTGITNPKVNG